MFPIALDLSKVPVLLVGEGDAFARRKQQLEESGATKLICRDAFNAYDLEDVMVVMVAGLDHDTSHYIARTARAEDKLVNVEDVNDLCDFYFTANVKRGDLLIAVSTNGASPTLAKRVRDKIASLFGPEWAGFTEEIKEQRLRLRAEGKDMSEVAKVSDEYLAQKGWLKEDAA